MAISFEQPAPAGFTDLAAKYGRMAAAQQGGAGGAANAGYQANLTDNAFRQAAENQDRELRGSTANADRAAQMENAGRQRQFQLVENEQQNAQRQEQMKTQAQLQVEVQNAELTQSERIHMQRLKNTLSDVQQKVSAGEYTPEEGKEISGQIQHGISGYQMRDAHATLLAKQQALADMHEQRAHAIALQNMDDVQRAKSFQSKIVPMTNPFTGKAVPGQLDQHGIWKPLFEDAPAKAEKPLDHNPNEFDYNRHVKKAEGEAKTAWATDKDKQAAYVQEIVNREKAAFDRGEVTNAGQQKPQAKAQPIQPAAPGSPVPQPGQPQQAAPQAPTPFTRYEPKTPEQVQRISQFNEAHASIGRRDDIAPEQKAQAAKALDEGMSLLEKYGSPKAMPAAEFEKLKQLDQQYEHLTRVTPKADPSSQGSTMEKLNRGDYVTMKDVKKALGTQSPTEGAPGRTNWEKFQDGDLVTFDDLFKKKGK